MGGVWSEPTTGGGGGGGRGGRYDYAHVVDGRARILFSTL